MFCYMVGLYGAAGLGRDWHPCPFFHLAYVFLDGDCIRESLLICHASPLTKVASMYRPLYFCECITRLSTLFFCNKSHRLDMWNICYPTVRDRVTGTQWHLAAEMASNLDSCLLISYFRITFDDISYSYDFKINVNGCCANFLSTIHTYGFYLSIVQCLCKF